LVGVQFQPQTKPIQMDQRCLSAFHQKSHAPLRVKTSNRAGFRAYSSCPVAVARLNAPAFPIPFYPQILLHSPNYIARWLRDDLGQRGIVIGREVQLRLGQRTDIHISAVPREQASSLENITVVIENKGCWNNEVHTAVDGQLVGDYLRPNGLTHGIYLVGWFVCDKWDNSQNKLTSKTFANAQQEIAQLAAAYNGKINPERVCAVLLDCGYPSSSHL
jgi:hypothetical protein